MSYLNAMTYGQQAKARAHALRQELDTMQFKAMSEGRDFNDDEARRLHEIRGEINAITDYFEKAEATQERLRKLGELGPYEPRDNSADGGLTGAAGWATKAAAAFDRARPVMAGGTKALVSTTIGVPTVIEPEVVPMASTPTSVLDLIPVKSTEGPEGSNMFTFLRQTVRTNNAAVVKDGAAKPTSVYTVAEVEDRYRVIAHLSEPIPQRILNDSSALMRFLQFEMFYGLRKALEAQVVSGTGAEGTPGDPTSALLTGIKNTSGVQAVAYATDIVTTAREAMTAMLNQGVEPTAWVLHPTDAEAFDLLREGGATGGYIMGGPGGPAEDRLWTIPRVISTAATAGEGLLGDWRAAELVVLAWARRRGPPLCSA